MNDIEKLRQMLYKEAVDYTVCTDGNVLQVKEDDRFYLRAYQAENGLQVILQYFEWTRKDKTPEEKVVYCHECVMHEHCPIEGVLAEVSGNKRSCGAGKRTEQLKYEKRNKIAMSQL